MTRMHTPREREILTHLSREEFNKAIARTLDITLDISHDTAQTRQTTAYRLASPLVVKTQEHQCQFAYC